MTDTPEGNRNALLALHYGEGAEVGTAAHVESCAACRRYLDDLEHVEAALRQWEDEAPPPDLRELVLARALREPQQPARPQVDSSAAPLLALLPVMAAFVTAVSYVGGWLAPLRQWEPLDRWPGLQDLAPFGAALLVLALLGGLASLAVAPALVLENRKT
jgi:hypothetical protein